MRWYHSCVQRPSVKTLSWPEGLLWSCLPMTSLIVFPHCLLQTHWPLWGLLLHPGPSPAVGTFSGFLLSQWILYPAVSHLLQAFCQSYLLSEILADCHTAWPPLAFLVPFIFYFFLTTLLINFQHTYTFIHVNSVGAGILVLCTDVSKHLETHGTGQEFNNTCWVGWMSEREREDENVWITNQEWAPST